MACVMNLFPALCSLLVVGRGDGAGGAHPCCLLVVSAVSRRLACVCATEQSVHGDASLSQELPEHVPSCQLGNP